MGVGEWEPIQAKVSLKDDAYEKQAERAHLLYNGSPLCWQ